jgi:hypothetical protein
MADTVRTGSYLLASVFQDGQADGSITAQDMRDLVVSVRPPYGRISMTGLPNTSATTISNTTDYFTVAGTTALASMVHDFDQPSSGRLRYTGTVEKHMHIACSISYKAAAANQSILFQLVHYDASAATAIPLTSSRIGDLIGTSTETTAIHADAMLDTNDYLYLTVRNSTGSNNVTVEYFYIFAMGMFE